MVSRYGNTFKRVMLPVTGYRVTLSIVMINQGGADGLVFARAANCMCGIERDKQHGEEGGGKDSVFFFSPLLVNILLEQAACHA